MTEEKFKEALVKLGINISDRQLTQLNEYYNLLVEWNEKVNLTAITKKEDVFLKHFYDSATMYKAINLYNIETLCDVGTGAGFPGLVLKILFPNLNITLIDALEKRIKFLNIVIKKLDLDNIITIHARSEDYAKSNRELYDVVTARAVASLPVLMEYCTPLVKVNKYFIPMKANISQEINDSSIAMNQLSLELDKKIEFLLPIENSQRTIIVYRKNAKTISKYPRKFAEIKKKPL